MLVMKASARLPSEAMNAISSTSSSIMAQRSVRSRLTIESCGTSRRKDRISRIVAMPVEAAEARNSAPIR